MAVSLQSASDLDVVGLLCIRQCLINLCTTVPPTKTRGKQIAKFN